jgi:hypothetical protein
MQYATYFNTLHFILAQMGAPPHGEPPEHPSALPGAGSADGRHAPTGTGTGRKKSSPWKKSWDPPLDIGSHSNATRQARGRA